MDASIEGVRVAGTPTGPVPVVLLTTAAESEFLPIFIGFDEAASIARGLDAEDVDRPLTHDLTLDIVEELGGRVERVVVSDVDDGTYLADLHLATPREGVVVDARPSDSLALAARTNAPIEIAEHVFEAGGRDPDEFDDLDDIREVMEV
ncbi:bifunctional nuclease family protein [Halorientalis brevis]|uniref:Bifunctional nuclease family protein n=1 Tax=Halorientalis brevis TaxID=1126241 RepID=A0ABD6CCM5_9EURY|nr:bifunctional nuclease family protein [Halorientalis brevis]